MKSGWITLYGSAGKKMKSKQYTSILHRHDIIHGWELLYGEKFKWYSIGIIPDIDFTDWKGH